MLTPACPDLNRKAFACPRPLPNREGILSPGHMCRMYISRRGEAGGMHRWMESCHHSVCFVRRPELDASPSTGNSIPTPAGKASRNIVYSHSLVSARMLCPYDSLAGVPRRVNPPLPLPHREGENAANRYLSHAEGE